jgi:hypothetical protein
VKRGPTRTLDAAPSEAAGIVRELTGKRRGRVFGYDRYLGLLNEGTTVPFER